jgi:hydroxyethylthiazole kinase
MHPKSWRLPVKRHPPRVSMPAMPYLPQKTPPGSCASATQAVIAVTGPVDLVIAPDGRRADIANGHPLMPRVTALGCALTGIVAAFAATTNDPFEAAVSALTYYGIAGEHAAMTSSHPGSFYVAFLDALHALDGPTLNVAATVTLS